jgi:hypothetical protein
VPILFLVADLDTSLPLRGMYDVAEARRPHALLRSGRADARALSHDAAAGVRSAREGHPADRELCGGDSAYRFTRGLGARDLDTDLRGDEAFAASWKTS